MQDSPPFSLRPPQVGDLGWIIRRQAQLYQQEYGWDWTFEGLLAEIVGSFVRNFRPADEACWVAERDGQVVGSVFCVHKADQVAQLRMLYVEPSTRGLGIGKRLVRECIGFARQRGYRRLVLWTNAGLDAARHIYEAEGFVLVGQESHHSFGKDQTGQHWELALTP